MDIQRHSTTTERLTKAGSHAAGPHRSGSTRRWEDFFHTRAFQFWLIVGQLGLVLLAMWRFQIEDSRSLPRLLPLIFGGFILHSLLPMPYRRTLFLALSVAGIVIVLPFPHSLILIAIGLGLIGVCHLPIAFRARVALIVLAGAVLAAVRAGWFASPMLDEFGQIILPVLGAMFMFRLAIYLYDMRHERAPATLSERLSYFFLLPNVSFLLFPVVDYEEYRRSYYNSEDYGIYQKGLLWMIRGVTHLLLYRLVYQYLVLAPGDVQNLTTVVQFMVTTYLLYLRISGQFHIIIGILCLFGFNLPETHHLYYLSSGFSDFWRRINIYWKDFMIKVIYYPVFFRTRRRFGMTGAIVPATLAVFLGTWILHSYQWFWLRNSFPITAPDGLFWGSLGVFVVFNSLREAQRRRTLSKTLTIGSALSVSFRTVGFFALMCVLWSLWSSSSLTGWLATISPAAQATSGEFFGLAVVLTALVGTGVLIQLAIESGRRKLSGTRWWFVQTPALRVLAISSLLLILTLPYVRRSIGPVPLSVLAKVRQDRLNVRDQQTADRGYYEGLLDQPVSALLTLDNTVPEGWFNIIQSDPVDRRTDLLEYELKPSYAGTYQKAPLTTNRWRMRDKEYPQAKPPGTYRIALVGASYEMAGGVRNDQSYEAVLEDLLNAEHSNGRYARFEILNFAVGGYSLIHEAIVVESRLALFNPDLVLLPVYSTENIRMLGHVARAVAKNTHIPYPELLSIIKPPGVTTAQTREQLKQRLDRFSDWSFRKLKADAEERGWPLLAVFIPTTTDKDDTAAENNIRRLLEGVRSAGIESVRLENVFDDSDASEIQLTRWDSHPSALGHRLIATKLYDVLLERQSQLFVQPNMRTEP